MLILERIQQDNIYLSQEISELKTQLQNEIGNPKDFFQLKVLVRELEGKKRHLDAILNSGITPEIYISQISRQTYYATSKELQSQHLKAENHIAFCQKTSRKRENINNSRFTLFHSDGQELNQFFVEHNPNKIYPDGGCSQKIKKGFTSNASEPKYALKVFRPEIFNNDLKKQLRLALRGAFCNRILGRQGYAFNHNFKQYILSEWLDGKTLDNFSEPEILNIDIPQRIKLALSLLSELSILHQFDIIHNDLKPANVMFCNDFSLKLFDFDSVRLEEESIPDTKEIIYTIGYIEHHILLSILNNQNEASMYLNKQTDLYALGLTLAKLFPDLLNIEKEKKIITCKQFFNKRFAYEAFNINKKIESNNEIMLTELLYNLTNPNENERLKSVSDIYTSFSSILKNVYHEEYIDLYSRDPIDTYAAFTTGKDAFEDIESELFSYEHHAMEAEKVIEFRYI